jgi:hypothetical protein
MLKDIDHIININKKGKFKYYYINNMEISSIDIFIKRLHEDNIYTIIPLISMFGKDLEPHLILSKSILLTNNSSTKLLFNYLNAKLDQAILDYGLSNIEDGIPFHLIFKYKKITLDLTKLPN